MMWLLLAVACLVAVVTVLVVRGQLPAGMDSPALKREMPKESETAERPEI